MRKNLLNEQMRHQIGSYRLSRDSVKAIFQMLETRQDSPPANTKKLRRLIIFPSY